MHEDSDSPEEHWPTGDGPDPDWPDDWLAAGGDEADSPPAGRVTRQGGGARRTLALAVTATIALGAGAGAVAVYRSAQGDWAPRAAGPAASGSAGPGSPAGGATVTCMVALGQVLAVGRDCVTVGGGLLPSVSSRVTSATRFTGAGTGS